MVELEFTTEAVVDLRYLRKFEQSLIIDDVDRQLTTEPTRQTKHRKPLRPNDLAKWELRIGKYRVFYDVSAAADSVKIKAIGWKEHNKLFIRGREYSL